jgi:DNA-directed RNA polymerase subunit alpha
MVNIPEAVAIIQKDGTTAVFEIGPLQSGYGATIANPLRRVLLSSLEGTAITSLKIKGVDHEFSSIDGVMEDVIEIILNLKKIRFRGFSDEPVTLTLSKKGSGAVTAGDIKLTSDVELVNPDQHIATLSDKAASLEMEITVEKGRGYVSTEQRQKEKLPIGVIAVDAVFSPVRKVNFTVEDTRVEDRIDFNKVVLEIETDGSVEPEAALKEAATILAKHFTMVSEVTVPEPKATKKTAPKKTSTKKTKKTEENEEDKS